MQLLDGTYSQKISFLVDVIGYSQEDMEEMGEIGLDNMIIDNWNTEEYLNFIS